MKTSSDPRFILSDGEVHVWRADLSDSQQASCLQPLLSSDELQRADRFRFPEHRRRFVIARGSLRRLLSSYLGIEAREVTFTYSAEGKPNLDARHRSDLCFNVSHSGNIAGFAFTRSRNIGIDVEIVRHDLDVDEIPQRFFSALEQHSLASLHGPEKYGGFFRCWTRKEAYVKAVGSGLSLPLRDFDVSLLPGESARLLATRPDPKLADRWEMASLDFGESCAAAVVVERPLQQLELRHFTPF